MIASNNQMPAPLPRPRGWWIGARRPLAQAALFGCVLSLVVSRKLTLPLIAGGAFAWSFIPIAQVAAFACARRRARPARPFAVDLDGFFANHRPWSLWAIGAGLIASFAPTIVVYSWSATTGGMTGVIATAVVPALAAARGDYRFFREALSRSRRDAVGDLLLQRAIAWTLATAYFFWYPGWPLVLRMLGR